MEYNLEVRGRAMGMIEAGMKQKRVAEAVGVGLRTLEYWWANYNVTREGGPAVPGHLALRQSQPRSVLCTRSGCLRHSPKQPTAFVAWTPQRWLTSPTFRENLAGVSYSKHALFTTATILHCTLTRHLAFERGSNNHFFIRCTILSIRHVNIYEHKMGGFLLSLSPTI